MTDIREDVDFLEEQPLEEDEKRLLELIYTRLDIFQEQDEKYHKIAREAREVVHMRDPKQDDAKSTKKNGKKMLQLQTLKSTINNVVADQMTSMPEPKLLPESPDMQQNADDLQDMIHYVTYCANNYEMLHYRRAEDFYVTGTAVTQIAWDPDAAWGKGEIELIRWPIEAFLWDPLADNLQDCRAVMKLGWKPLSWFRDHYPDAGRYVMSDDGEHANVGMTDGQEDADHANDEKRALMIEYWWREYKDGKYIINVAYAAGHALLDVNRNIYAHGMYPFVLDVHDSIEGMMIGAGLVEELRPLMQYINRYASYMDTNARYASKGRMVVRKESGIDREALADFDNDIIEGNSVEQGRDWNWMQSNPFPASIQQMMMQFQTDLKQDSGANQFTRGETTGGIVSGKAINSLIQAGGKVSVMRTEQLNYGVKEIYEQILWLMAQFYDDNRVIMIAGREQALKVDAKRLFGRKTRGAVNPPPYTVQVEVSTRDPQRIASQNQMFMEAYTMAAQAQQFFPLSSLFKMLNLDGKDKILPVIRENEAYQQQMQQMQQQVEQMGTQMQQMQQERDSLRRVNTQMTNALAQVGRGQQETVDQARGAMGQPTSQDMMTMM